MMPRQIIKKSDLIGYAVSLAQSLRDCQADIKFSVVRNMFFHGLYM